MTSLLSRATRATKGIDQEAMATLPGAVYVPLENRQTWTGEMVAGDDSALAIVTFYACVRVLAESVASVPLILYRRLPNGGKERATDHELYPVLHDAPNPEMTSFVWRETLVGHLATWGNSYNEIVEDGFGGMQLWPLRPDRIQARWGPGDTKVFDYLSTIGRRTTQLADGTIFHIPGLSSNGLVGLSPISLHREALGLYQALQDFGASTMRNMARPAVVMTHPKTLSKGAIERLATQMDDLRGSGNAGKTIVMEEGLTIKEIGVPPEDAQYIQSRDFQAREVARMFRMPPHMIGDLERATFTNIEHQSIDFVVYTLMPWLVRIEQEIKSQLLFDQDEYFVEFLVDGLLRGDAVTRAQALQIQRQNGVINGDEWRAIENRNPIEDGSGKAFWMPVNFQAAVTDQVDPGQSADPAIDTGQPSIDAMPMPALTVVKSAAVRCSKCNRLLAEQASPPYRITCSRCKTVTEAQPAEVA